MWREVEADFLREYGVQMDADLHRMSWRKFAALFSGLPDGCATARALMSRADPRSAAHSADEPTQRQAAAGFAAWLRHNPMQRS